MASSSFRFRHKQQFTEMGKSDGNPQTIIQSSGMSPKAYGNHKLHSDLSYGGGKLKILENHDSENKCKFHKNETFLTNGFRNNSHINFEPSFRWKSSNELALSHSSPATNRNYELASTMPFQQESNHGSTSGSELDREPQLILMSCFNCYLHVMVCDASPKCPKCCKGDCLLDIFRLNPPKKAGIM